MHELEKDWEALAKISNFQTLKGIEIYLSNKTQIAIEQTGMQPEAEILHF